MTDPLTVQEFEAASKQTALVKVMAEVINGVDFTWRFCQGRSYPYNGNRYEGRAVSVSSTARGQASIARLTVKIDNRDELLGLDVTNSSRTIGAECNIVMLTANPQNAYGTPIILISGSVVRLQVGDDITLEVSILYGQRREASLIKGSRNCGNPYKGILCGYAGALPTCLRTEADCVVHARRPFFNSAIHAPSPGSSIPIGSQIVRVPSSRTDWYGPRSDWGDDDSALGDPQRERTETDLSLIPIFHIGADGPIELDEDNVFD